MDFTLSDDQLELGRLAARVLETGGPVGAGVDSALWSRLADADLLGVAVPEEFGGLGLGLVELCELLRQFGRHVPRIPLLGAAIAGAAVARFGSEPLKKAVLPDLTYGAGFPAEAFSTTTAGPTSGGSALTATESGGTWRLNGRLASVPYAAEATWLLTAAKTPTGPATVVVDLRSDSIEAAGQERGDHSQAAELRFDGVPVDEVFDRPGESDVITWITQVGTLATCATQLGAAQRALELTAAYVSDRRQFGRPLAGFQAVGQRAADAYIDVWAQELTLSSALWRLTAGLDAALDVDLAKLWAAQGGQRVVAAAVHLHGGTGTDRSYPLHRFFLAQTELSTRFGGAGQSLSRIATRLRAMPEEVV